MSKIVIWGAGKKGIGISDKLRKNDILYFCDNDVNKIGNYINGYKVESAEKLYSENSDEVILISTIPLGELGMTKVIGRWKGKIYYYEEYFMQDNIVKQLDTDLLSKYYFDNRVKDNIFISSKKNWFREDAYSDINRRLIKSIKARDTMTACKIMEKAYNSGTKYSDECFDVRPGMRLIYNIICKEFDAKCRIVDFACGHGELIQKIAQEGYQAYAVDFSADRLSQLVNVRAYAGDVKKTTFENESFDVSICMECMEHIDDVTELSRELIRVTKKNGLIFVTVPYLKYCDDEMHIRQFDETSLWGLFSAQCVLENIIVIPYLNYTSDDNIIMAVRKQ